MSTPCTIRFGSLKQPILRFDAENVQTEKQPEGLLIITSGAMEFQDTPLLANLADAGGMCTISMLTGDTPILEGQYEICLLECESDKLAFRITA